MPHRPSPVPRAGPAPAPAGSAAARSLHALTVQFCQRFLARADATAGEMRQAAGAAHRQLAEAYRVGAAFPAVGLRLAQAARASLGDLRAEFADFLATRYQPVWPSDSPNAAFIHHLAPRGHGAGPPYRPCCENLPAEAVANLALCLIREANQQLTRHIAAWEQLPPVSPRAAAPPAPTLLALRTPAAA